MARSRFLLYSGLFLSDITVKEESGPSEQTVSGFEKVYADNGDNVLVKTFYVISTVNSQVGRCS